MKENQTPVVPVATPQVAVEQPKQSNFLVILLSTLLLLSVLIAGFFAYQTQKLVKELTLLRTEPTPTTTSESVVSPELTFEQDKTLNPTANWKTYKNTSSNYEIKYPAEWRASNIAAGSDGTLPANARYIEIGLGEGKSGTLGIEELQMIPPSEEANLTSTKVVGSLTLRCNGKFTTDTKTWCWIKVPNQEKYLNIQLFKNSNEVTNSLLDQILSTFKFTN